ncbi:DUF385 domain-containing protein [Homoserinibacter sp. GY 40078]|nr:DUF385 domain-containing protein [Homoserinibacter sp. GY 40078]
MGWMVRRGVGLKGAAILEVRGRKSGEPRTTPVNPLSLDGERYLLAPRGETEWVRNIRVAGEAALITRRGREEFAVVEVTHGDKLPIIRAYLREWAWEVGAFFEGLSAKSDDVDLMDAAPGFPVFQITPRLDELRERWLRVRDGESGMHYGRGLEAAGDAAAAEAVYEELIATDYLVGYYELAWLRFRNEEVEAALDLLRACLRLDESPDDFTSSIAGQLGHWMWDATADPDAEDLLRRGLEHPDARADLAHLLMATNRAGEAEQVLREGVTLGDKGSFIVLGNLLARSDREAEAEEMYRRGYAAGDAFSAYNLSLLLDDQGRGDEADAWLIRAANGGDQFAIDRLT